MRGFLDNDFFGGHFGPQFGGMSGPNCPFRGTYPGHHGRRADFGPFGAFDYSPERHGHHHNGPEHHRRGPPEEGHRERGCDQHGSDNDGPEEQCRGPLGFKGPGSRPDFHGHGPSCRGPHPYFERNHERGNEHHRRGPPKDCHSGRKCGHHGPSDSDSDEPEGFHCHGPPGFGGRRGGRPHGFHGHGPSCHGPRPCFGRRGPFDFPNRPFRGPRDGPWGSDHPMNRFGPHGSTAPWFGRGRPCPYNSEERPSRKSNCEKCRETEPCCSGHKEHRERGKGKKDNGPCCDKDKDQNLGDTVFVQRIVLEKAARPQSV